MTGSVTYLNYESACKTVVDIFVLKYFKDRPYVDFIGDECDGVVNINDYFFSVQFMAKCLKLGIVRKKMFDYYDYQLDAYSKKGTLMNLESWLKLK